MLSPIRNWQCDIWPDLIRLRCEENVVITHERGENETLVDALNVVLSSCRAILPWRDSVTFHLDTEQLIYIVQPWLPGISTPQDMLSLARLRASSLNSSKLQDIDWQVSFEDVTWQQSALVACLKQSCWQLLVSAAKSHRLRFRGVITPFQQLLKNVNRPLAETGLFICSNPRHSRIARRQNNTWQEVYTLSLPSQDINAQLKIIARLSGMESSPQHIIDCTSLEYFLANAEEACT